MAWLPSSLPSSLSPTWSIRLSSDGLSGLAVAEGAVVVPSRDITDSRNVFTCVDGATGQVRWKHQYPAPGSFDYGNSPRATPIISGGKVWTHGASGHVHCLDLKSGTLLWQKNIAAEFRTPRLEWGLTGSPLLVDGRLIVQPGGEIANVVALDAETGEVAWKSEPGLPGHSSFIAATLGDKKQVIGHDDVSLGGWDLETGKRLWGIVPKLKGDFNVATPLLVANHLVATTEGNATRSYAIGNDGVPSPTPTSTSDLLAPDSSTPVAIGNRLYGLTDGLFCLDVAEGLRQIWALEDDAMSGYGSLIACPRLNRLLVLTLAARLLLIEDTGTAGRVVARLALDGDDAETHSHPAIVGDMLYVRVGQKLSAYRLSDPSNRAG